MYKDQYTTKWSKYRKDKKQLSEQRKFHSQHSCPPPPSLIIFNTTDVPSEKLPEFQLFT